MRSAIVEGDAGAATRSRTVCETSTSLASAIEATRAPMLTAIPATFESAISHSPVWMPARIGTSSSRMSSLIARAHRIARAGPSKLAKNPSPAVSISRPRKRASRARTRR